MTYGVAAVVPSHGELLGYLWAGELGTVREC